jgi:imidazoleglycerol phosphate dehydratase HisB
MVYIRPGDSAQVPAVERDLRLAVAAVAVRIESDNEDLDAAVQTAVPYFDRVLESLSFQMQFPLQIQGPRGGPRSFRSAGESCA